MVLAPVQVTGGQIVGTDDGSVRSWLGVAVRSAAGRRVALALAPAGRVVGRCAASATPVGRLCPDRDLGGGAQE
ncbi:hypothetical protein ABI_14230 [Asticcacaulis biprosthecium C19]|uniref:Uncharacterized protein n=1 Tax=Asticcacaulis biprosthecium C19 TaxID=715226 RepID=F4QIJ5_9CAUL|nr:hypothetical protein ABI_14230 [Asticcacaulis biprosthecium C19]